MTRKHYRIIAKAISQARFAKMENLLNVPNLITQLSRAFKADNFKFNINKFENACIKKQ